MTNEKPPADPTPIELYGRLAAAIQTIAETLNTDHPGHPCHGLAGRVEAVLLGMQGPRPIGLGSGPAGTAPPAAKSNISPDDVIDPNWKPAPKPVKQTTGDDGA